MFGGLDTTHETRYLLSMSKTTNKGTAMYFASELRYIGKGTIESTEQGTGNLIVRLDDGRRGRVESSQCFNTKREALMHTQVPQRNGWSAAAQLLGAQA